jgi:hypothetical protein
MISLTLRLDPIDCHTRGTVLMALDDLCYIDSIAYLKKTATNIEFTELHYLASVHMYQVTFDFHLDSKHETFFRIKYRH